MPLNVHLLYGTIAEGKIVSFINEKFGLERNAFYFIKDQTKSGNELKPAPPNYIYVDNDAKKKRMMIDLNLADRIHIYALTLSSLKLLHENRHLLPKVDWMIWGADLYYPSLEPMESLRKQLIPSFGMVSTNSKHEYDLAVSKYGATGERRRIIIGPTPMGLEYIDTQVRNVPNDVVKIQVSHSANPSSRTIEILDALAKYKDEAVMIYAPISYGSKDYAKKVEEHGRELFGDKFVPMTVGMEPREYSNFLRGMDVAVFNFNHMHGLGNIYGLMDYGCKVYVPGSSIGYDFLKNELGVSIHRTEDIHGLNFKQFAENLEKDRIKNHEIIRQEIHSVGRMEELWSNILVLEHSPDNITKSLMRLTGSYDELRLDYEYLVGLHEGRFLEVPTDYNDFIKVGKTKSIELVNDGLVVEVGHPTIASYVQLFSGGFREPPKDKIKSAIPRIAREVVLTLFVDVLENVGTPVIEVFFMQYDDNDRVLTTSVSNRIDTGSKTFEVRSFRSLNAKYFKVAVRLAGFNGSVRISKLRIRFYLD